MRPHDCSGRIVAAAFESENGQHIGHCASLHLALLAGYHRGAILTIPTRDLPLSATLLLTRPRAASERLLGALTAALGAPVPAILSPVMQITAIDARPDTSGAAALIITSAHGARFAGPLDGRGAYVVGARTADAVVAAGGTVLHQAPDSTALLQHLAAKRPKGPLLWLRGRHASGDIAARSSAMGIPAEQVIVYDQPALPLTPEMLEALQGERRAILPL
ncbi:MAG TPA: uroporphyrinogen-III synthase, partial [Aliiroseovarius sp.]|nr:uroporphyrinogen-III synthase [Aliiroseovarius sp.]